MIKGLPTKLQSLRAKYGYSQKQVAEKLNVSPALISSYETGERTPAQTYYCNYRTFIIAVQIICWDEKTLTLKSY